MKQFSGKLECLSNMYLIPFEYKGIKFSSSEQAYQYMKTCNEEILKNKDPKYIKYLGRQFPMVENFEITKLRVMYEILRCKFTQNQNILDVLMSTPDSELVEYNTWHDSFWGHCVCNKCIKITKKNHLGLLLQELKRELTFYSE